MPAPSSSQSEARADGRENGPLGDLTRKLIWLTVFRTVATTLLLGTIAVRLLSGPPIEDFSRADSASFVVIALVYGLTLVYGLLLRRGVVGRGVAYLQVLGDVVLASCLVYLTGGADSPFMFTYSLAVVAASILLFERGALVAAAVSSVAFASLVLAIQTRLLRAPPDSGPQPLGRLAFLLASNVLAQLLIAALAGYLSRQLYATGGRLSASEADLKALVELQNQIVTAMPSGLITAAADGQVTYVNPAGAAILGLADGARAGGLEVDKLLPGAQRLKPGRRRSELAVGTPLGQRTLGLAIAPLEGASGSTLIVFQDLTDLRRMEDELRRADHLASLGKLSAQLAHEIRNPLAAMRGSAQMLAGEATADPASTKLAGILIREADRLSALVEDFLRFSRPPPPNLQDQDLASLASDTVEMLRSDPLARQVEVELALGRARAPVDAGQIRQVLINLLRNAFAAAHPGGRVRVGVEEEGGQATIRVWDSAGSIPPADYARIFEPFFTTRPGGTGLGLSTAHSIIRAHGGMIRVTSSPAEGTEFQVTLPQQPAEE